MSFTYSELRQKVLFKAARDMRAVAAEVLNDVAEIHHPQSLATYVWAKQLAAKTARRANDLETEGYEACYAEPRILVSLHKSSRDYSRAIDNFTRSLIADGFSEVQMQDEIDRLNRPIAPPR